MVILRKSLALIICLALCVLAFCACSEKGKYYSADEITERVMTYTDSKIDWVPLKADALSGYFGFSDADIKDYSAFISSSEAGYDIVAAFEFKNGEALKSSVARLNEKLDNTMDNFSAVKESESAKIRERIILSKDEMLVVIVCANSKSINDELKRMGFSEIG